SCWTWTPPRVRGGPRSPCPEPSARSGRGKGESGRFEPGAHLLDGAAEHARDVHLRQADGLADLRLREVEEVAQRDDAPLALPERLRRGGDERTRDAEVVQLVADRERVRQVALERDRHAGGRERGAVAAVGIPRDAHDCAAVPQVTADL